MGTSFGGTLHPCKPQPFPSFILPTGKFARDNCPSYLTPEGFQKLKEGALDALR